MSASSQTVVQSIRISAEDFNARWQGGESVTVLDMRSQKAWDSSDLKIPGALRISPDRFQIDPSWPKDRLTVAY
jgi:hypothetical protein